MAVSFMEYIVSISEMKLSKDPADIIVTYSLGSSIGLSLYDPVTKIGGLIHCMLPMSNTGNKNSFETNPCTFVDSGVSSILETMFEMGITGENIKAKVAGASNLLDDHGILCIGERNFAMLKKILWKNGIELESADTGGQQIRSMSLRMRDGVTTVRFGKVEIVI